MCVCACHISGAVRSGMNYSSRLYPGLVGRMREEERKRKGGGAEVGSRKIGKGKDKAAPKNEIVGFSL